MVANVVKRQVAIGLDCIGDGEYWSALDIRWFDQQMTGLSTRPLKPGEVGSMRESTRERDVFRTLYADMDRVGTIACIPGATMGSADPARSLCARIVHASCSRNGSA